MLCVPNFFLHYFEKVFKARKNDLKIPHMHMLKQQISAPSHTLTKLDLLEGKKSLKKKQPNKQQKIMFFPMHLEYVKLKAFFLLFSWRF